MKFGPVKAKLGPLPVRLQHGAVEFARETVKDTNGAPTQHYRSVYKMEMLLHRGSMVREMG